MEKNSESNGDCWVEERLSALTPGDWQPDATQGLARLHERRGWGRPFGLPFNFTKGCYAAAAAILAGACLMALPPPEVLAQRCVECGRQILGFVKGGAKSEKAPTTAPDFTLPDASGNPVKLSDFKGKVVLLNFWATWCRPCAIEIPWLIEFQQTYGDRGLVVLGVSLDEDGWDIVEPFVKQKKINYRVMIGDDGVAATFGGVQSLPATLMIDKSGRIAATHTGLVSKSEYQAEIEKLLR